MCLVVPPATQDCEIAVTDHTQTSGSCARDVLLVVDVLDDFGHEHGPQLLSSLTDRHQPLVAALESARASRVPILYANDDKGVWDGDVGRLIHAARQGPGGHLIEALTPSEGDRFIVKPRYSAFDHTPLELILEELKCERLFVVGMTSEGCVTQSAIDARERGLKVTVLPNACATIDGALERTAFRYLVDVAGVKLEDVQLGLFTSAPGTCGTWTLRT